MRAFVLATLVLPLAAQGTPSPGPDSSFAKRPAFPLDPLLERHQGLGDSAELLAQRARLCFLAGQAEKGEALVNAALQKAPAKGEILRLAAAAWLSAGQPDKAFALHQRMLEVAPKADDAMAWAAGDLVQSGFPERADALMERAYQLDPRDKDELLAFGMIAARAGQERLAAKWLARITGMDKSDARQDGLPALRELLGAGRAEAGAALADRLLEVLSRDAEIALEVARAFHRLGRPEETRAWMKRAESIAPTHPRLLIELALLAKGLDQTFRD